MKILAKILSYLFHPVLFFLLMPFLIVYKETSNSLYAIKWMMFSAAFVIFGIIIVFLETFKGTFSDVDLSVRTERSKFFTTAFIIAILYLAVAFFFKGFIFPLSIIAVGIAFGIVSFAVINMFVKASIHMAVVCAFVISIGILYGFSNAAFFLILIPIVAWSRLILKRHTLLEIVIGAVAGSVITFVTFMIGKTFV